jgi:leucine dehydrogenase
MIIFESLQDMGHEQVLFFHDKEAKLKGIIAIHDASLGLAMGATRLFPFVNEDAALYDVLRLSRGMTYKAAGANIPVGGGKAVIIAKPEEKTEKLLKAYGRVVQGLKGRFITGQDVNISSQDVLKIRSETDYVVGISNESEGPVMATAKGVILGIKAALKFKHELTDLRGLRVAVQGLGNVGTELCCLLSKCGVELFVCDLDRNRTEKVRQLYDARVVNPNEIYSLDVEVFSPCALGGILNSKTIPMINALVVAGSANNQLENEQLDSELLSSKGILYCPDFIINSGGLICVYNEMIGVESKCKAILVENIYKTLIEIFSSATRDGLNTYESSIKIVEERIAKRPFIK